MRLLERFSRTSQNSVPVRTTEYKGRATPMLKLRLFGAVAIVLTIFTTSLMTPSSTQAEQFASPAFERTWRRSDLPVLQQAVKRSFIYGVEGFYSTYEPYSDSPNGQRLVQYFDKARMEITQPGNDQNNPYYVTNGLIVKELVLGNLQLGDYTFTTRYPAYGIPIAGDPTNNDTAPTYASFYDVASTQVNRPQVAKTGEFVTQTIGKSGQVDNNAALGALTTYAHFEPVLGHNIAKPFWDFFNLKGLIFEGQNPAVGSVFNWLYTVGYPITEPYWIVTTTGGARKDVLVQLFERRVLTWTPSNSPDFQVEMGNVGRHYFSWRYDSKYDVPVLPSSQATINPSAGFPGAKFVIKSPHFIPSEPIEVTYQNPEGKVISNFDITAANPKGELLYVIGTNPGAPKGQYSLIFNGVASGNRSVVYFRLIGIPGITE